METYTLLERIKIRLRQFHIENDEVVFDNADENIILEELINENIAMAIDFCQFAEGKDDDYKHDYVLENYSNEVLEGVLYDYMTEGAEFQTSHNENGINRTYIDKRTIFSNIKPFVTILT